MNIVGRRKIWYGIVLLLLIPGLISLMLQGLNMGIDFRGGSLLQIQMEQQPDVAKIRTVLDQYQLGASSYIQLSENNNVLIRTVSLEQDKLNQIMESMRGQFGKIELLRDENVGPVIGKELATNALLALGMAMLAIVGYMTYRFEFKFAIAGILSLFSVVLITTGIYSIFQIEIDGSFVAAILTVIGYCIHDTIVIFDRIRENLQRKKRDEALEDLVNRSVLETMTRSINTVLTVVFVLGALLVFGGETIRVFTLAMLIGVVLGGCSSIFNASQLWLDFKLWEKAQRVKAKTNAV
ncbi:protein translocase subunit SecF [Heliophilum fasciatum]|uniref:Protein-export membrane protein SecF n=1 Tax=Heliophilum fasciatum TaxID=35700 RepID=A0A4R2RKB9_9FIRM|nr:protein translocase subunit SecF [Heliophilum fasciatum]MCW2278060.1 preprotein translocase subunit SecF [Heliophilum fasciatum]TCP64320.1 protein translocase subunit secF [Heliophilum fasciatum]